MNISHEIKCKICCKKMEYLNSELINLPIHREGDDIGAHQHIKAINVRFYCGMQIGMQ